MSRRPSTSSLRTSSSGSTSPAGRPPASCPPQQRARRPVRSCGHSASPTSGRPMRSPAPPSPHPAAGRPTHSFGLLRQRRLVAQAGFAERSSITGRTSRAARHTAVGAHRLTAPAGSQGPGSRSVKPVGSSLYLKAAAAGSVIRLAFLEGEPVVPALAGEDRAGRLDDDRGRLVVQGLFHPRGVRFQNGLLPGEVGAVAHPSRSVIE